MKINNVTQFLDIEFKVEMERSEKAFEKRIRKHLDSLSNQQLTLERIEKIDAHRKGMKMNRYILKFIVA